MESNKINHLAKDEIIFELIARNVEFEEDADSNEVRKILRKAIREKVPTNILNFNKRLSFTNEITVCQKKLDFCQTFIETLDSTSRPKYVNKARAKLLHMKLRVQVLNGFQVKPDQLEQVNKVATLFKSVQDQFDIIMSDQDRANLSEEDEELNKTFLEIESEPEMPVKKSDLNTLPSATENITANIDPQVSVTNNSVTPATTVVPNPIQEKAPPMANASQCLDQPRVTETVCASIFAKIQNPLDHKIKNFTITDGLNVTELLNFLKHLLKLRDTKISLPDVHVILSNVSKGPLLSKIEYCISNNFSINQIHSTVLQTFVPMPMLVRLKEDLVHRPQKVDEPMSVYVFEIQKFSNLLLCGYSDKALIEFIMCGLNASTRSCISGHNYPNTLSDLDYLCGICQSVAYKDIQRSYLPHYSRECTINDAPSSPRQTAAPHTPPYHRPAFHNTVTVPTNTAHYSAANNPPYHGNQYQNTYYPNATPLVCYTCGKKGHKSKQCYHNKSQTYYNTKN